MPRAEKIEYISEEERARREYASRPFVAQDLLGHEIRFRHHIDRKEAFAAGHAFPVTPAGKLDVGAVLDVHLAKLAQARGVDPKLTGDAMVNELKRA